MDRGWPDWRTTYHDTKCSVRLLLTRTFATITKLQYTSMLPSFPCRQEKINCFLYGETALLAQQDFNRLKNPKDCVVLIMFVMEGLCSSLTHNFKDSIITMQLYNNTFINILLPRCRYFHHYEFLQGHNSCLWSNDAWVHGVQENSPSTVNLNDLNASLRPYLLESFSISIYIMLNILSSMLINDMYYITVNYLLLSPTT